MVSLEHVFSVLLSPFDGTSDEWQDSSATALKEFLGADFSMYSETSIGQMSFRVADAPLTGTDALGTISNDMARALPIHPSVKRMMQLERSGKLPVFTTPLLDSVFDGRFSETPFFRDVMHPAGMNHIAGLVSVGSTATRRISVGWDRKRRVRLGEKTLATLRSVHPVFEAACRLIDYGELTRRALLSTVDESSDGIALITLDATVLHRNPALRRLLGMGEEAFGIEDAIMELAKRHASTARQGTPQGSADVRARTTIGEYALRGVAMTPTFGIPAGTILVTVSDVGGQLPLAGEIERRFGLTRRQAEVARLLAGRLSDAEIAKRLGLSWHTVRSHTDRVFRAMNVHSRFELVKRITSVDE